MLNSVQTGADTGAPPLLIVHGLFGSARNWTAIARRLGEARPVITVDMRNHGDSPFAAPHDYPAMAADLAEVIAAKGDVVDVLGHSMGGKAAMVLALTRPDLVRRLIVADIAPVTYTHTQIHLIRAMRNLDLTGAPLRSVADQRLSVAISDPGVRAFLLQSLDLRAVPPRWKLNLDQLEADMPAILSFPGTDARFDGPVLILRGSESPYVTPAMHPTIRALFPGAQFQTIEGAGHWVHADRPREVTGAIETFLT